MTGAHSLAHITAHLAEVVDRVERHHDRFVFTRNGRPAAVLVSPGDADHLPGPQWTP